LVCGPVAAHKIAAPALGPRLDAGVAEALAPARGLALVHGEAAAASLRRLGVQRVVVDEAAHWVPSRQHGRGRLRLRGHSRRGARRGGGGFGRLFAGDLDAVRGPVLPVAAVETDRRVPAAECLGGDGKHVIPHHDAALAFVVVIPVAARLDGVGQHIGLRRLASLSQVHCRRPGFPGHHGKPEGCRRERRENHDAELATWRPSGGGMDKRMMVRYGMSVRLAGADTRQQGGEGEGRSTS
jgi:hypothetical protein